MKAESGKTETLKIVLSKLDEHALRQSIEKISAQLTRFASESASALNLEFDA
jgi:hypothetical protein